MSRTLHDLLPDPDALLALEPEELAGVLLEHFHGLASEGRGQFHQSNIILGHAVEDYPAPKRHSVTGAFIEAWQWLEREGLLVPKAGDTNNWMVLSRRGQKLRTRVDLTAYQHGNLLPRAQLHPKIATKVYSTFLRGDYDTAVFQAFKEVEVAVREAANLAATDLGTGLMRKAFDKATGPLSDQSRPEGEREAMAHLFAGAIGLYKNPHSHRNVPLTDPIEAVEMIVHASHLLRIVEGRRDVKGQ